MCVNGNCKYYKICELYEDHYEEPHLCLLVLFGEEEMERMLMYNELNVDKVENECYDNIKEEI